MEIKRDPNGDIHIHITNINTNSNVNENANTNDNINAENDEEESHFVSDLFKTAAIAAATGLVSLFF